MSGRATWKAFRLAAGLMLVALGGCASPQPGPVTSDSQGLTDEQLVDNLLRYARAPGADAMGPIPFAPEVSLGLGDALLAGRLAEELVEPEAWVLQAAGPAGFRERTGPFSALEVLAQSDEVVVARGPLALRPLTHRRVIRHGHI